MFPYISKCTRIEIHLLTPQGLQPMLDVPMYGRIATLELFRPHGEAQDFLFIATERYKFCVLQWDPEAAELVTRAMGDVSDRIGRPTDNGQIGIIDPDCRLIGLHLYDGLFKVIPFDNKGQLKEAFNIRLEELQVLDIKFLYGCTRPTIVVLYQDNKDARHVKTYEVSLKDKDFIEGPWSQNNLDNGADLLIPVPPPLCGVIIVGEETIVYCSATAFKAIPIRPSITRAYGRVDADGSRYLLGDHAGLLHLLVITHEKEKVTGLKIELLGETSIASTISYLDNAFVFVGSSYGDSQGRILVFVVEDGKLQLIAEKETKGAVYSLNAFNGKLLAAINQKIQLYKWMLRDDGTHELQSECGHHGHILALYVQTRGDFIVVGDLMKSISLLIYKVAFSNAHLYVYPCVHACIDCILA
ncbi:DNA damage-binding protein 1a [Bienertia sinuspersici]